MEKWNFGVQPGGSCMLSSAAAAAGCEREAFVMQYGNTFLCSFTQIFIHNFEYQNKKCMKLQDLYRHTLHNSYSN